MDNTSDAENQARGLLLRAQLPLGSGVGDTESFALRVALGIAAGQRDHHGDVASVLYGIAHTLVEERGLQPAPAKFGNSCGSSKEGDALMQAKNPGSARFGIDLGEEAHATLAR